MLEISFEDAKETVLKAAGMKKEAASGSKVKEWLNYNDQVELVGLIAQLAREANIAATAAYDTLFTDPSLLKGLQGARRQEKIEHPETFTVAELKEIGQYIQGKREANKDKVLTAEPLVHMARFGSTGRFSGPGRGEKRTSAEHDDDGAEIMR